MNSAEVAAKLGANLATHYEIEREIGAGGMATVFLARDVRHQRKVAFKVLKPELGAVLGVERFLSEIRVTANLQHPNLLPLFDSGEADGLLYYVMPFVEGESLRARLDRERQLPIDEAIRIAVLIAGALDYAHGSGVIHRDLKPENILLSRGQPLVADFGIALAVSLAGGARVTQTGLSLGTPQYMSPEQATGDRQIDARTDVYSLAAMLFEMLTGDPPHSASTVQAVIAKVLTERPASVRTMRPNVPEYVAGAIASALEKLPADRIATAGEFARALEGKSVALPVAYSGGSPARAVATAQIVNVGLREKIREPITATLIAIVALLSIAAIWGWNHGKGPAAVSTGPATRFTITIPVDQGVPLSGSGGLAISPDGSAFVWPAASVDSGKLYLRSGNNLNAIAIPGTERATRPSFSPDGKWIAFQVPDHEVRKVRLDGFNIVKVANIPHNRELGSWTDNETLVLQGDEGLALLPASGGTLTSLTIADIARGEESHDRPYVSPGGEKIFFAIAGDSTADIAVVTLRTRKVQRLGLGDVTVFGIIDGHLIYQSMDNQMYAIPFDFSRDTLAGTPLLVGESLSGAHVSASGTLFTRATAPERRSDIIALSMDGTRRILVPDVKASGEIRYSPNARRIALRMESDNGAIIAIYDLASHTFDPFTRGGDRRAEWSPDGKRILFTHNVNGTEEIWWKSADGVGQAEVLQRHPNGLVQGILSHDSQWLFWRQGPRQIWYRRLLGDTTARRFTQGSSPHLTNDGRWLTYTSAETGAFRVYARAFPGTSARYPVSLGEAFEPMWSKDGQTIYYREGTSLIAASVVTSPEFAVRARKAIASDIRGGLNQSRNYDLAPDGTHFLMLEPQAGASVTLLVVHNWAAEVRARLAEARGK